MCTLCAQVCTAFGVQASSLHPVASVLPLLGAGSETAGALISSPTSKWYWNPVFGTTMPTFTSVQDLPKPWHVKWVLWPVLAPMLAELVLALLAASSLWGTVFPDIVSLVYGLCDAASTIGLCRALFACTYCGFDASDILAPVRGCGLPHTTGRPHLAHHRGAVTVANAVHVTTPLMCLFLGKRRQVCACNRFLTFWQNVPTILSSTVSRNYMITVVVTSGVVYIANTLVMFSIDWGTVRATAYVGWRTHALNMGPGYDDPTCKTLDWRH